MNRNRLASMLVLVAALACGAAAAGANQAEESAKAEYQRAIGLTPNLENGRKIYMTCAVCHRPEGWGTPDGAYPQIAGQLATVIIKQLADIRAGNRNNPIMYPFAVPQILGGAQEIADVAAYIASLPMTRSNGLGPGIDLQQGKQLYEDNCVECHGATGEGNEEDHMPSIWGQHYYYLVRQFEDIKSGRRKNSDPEMQKQIRRFSMREIRSVLDYTSRLKPSEDKLADSPDWMNPDFPNYLRPPAMNSVPNI